MKAPRAAKCSLKFANLGKIRKLEEILAEYDRVVNRLIEWFLGRKPIRNEKG